MNWFISVAVSSYTSRALTFLSTFRVVDLTRDGVQVNFPFPLFQHHMTATPSHWTLLCDWIVLVQSDSDVKNRVKMNACNFRVTHTVWEL